VAGPGDGLGIGRPPISCVGWTHAGEIPGYQVAAVSSADGRRQVVLMANQDGSTLPRRANTLMDELIDKAYCGRA
jgi:D-alanyl-D-alanine carboxypeptidase